MFKIRYGIVYYSQVLYSGSWGQPDCDWDWESRCEMYPTREEAEAVFKTLSPTDDTPINRLYEVHVDKYDLSEDEILLDEIS